MRFLLALITAAAITACHKEPEKTAAQLRAEIHAAGQGSGFEWLAEKVQSRAKRLRDNPAGLEPVVFEFNFMAEIVSKCIEDKTQQSESVKKLREQMETVRAYMLDLKEKLKELFKGSEGDVVK